MDKAFFTSAPFYVALAVALGLVAAGAATYAGGNFVFEPFQRTGCDPIPVSGAALEPEASTETRDGGRERVTTYRLDAAALGNGTLRTCLAVGRAAFAPGDGDEVVVKVTTTSKSAAAVDDTVVEVRFADEGASFGLAVWEARVGQARSAFDAEGARVAVEVLVPADRSYAVDATTDVGDVDLVDLRLSRLAARTDVGDVTGARLDLEGDLDAAADVGDVSLALRSVQAGLLTLAADVGDLDLRLPVRADVGYDVRAVTDVGSVRVDVGEAERDVRSGEGPGDEADVRTRGYAEKPTKVRVEARADVGAIDIVAA